MSKSPCNAKHEPSGSFTPGPWRPNGGLVETRDGIALGIATACPVKVGYAPKDDAERLANARLIAAAPELLRELKSVLFFIESFKDHEETLAAHEVFSRFAEAGNWEQVQAIIAKAEEASHV